MITRNTQALAKSLVSLILTGRYTPIDLRLFVHLCYRLALPLVRKKIVAGKLKSEFFRLNESDLVFDCLAELFQRNPEGRFVVLESYFRNDAVYSAENAEVLVELRTIVFHVVSRGFIRLYGEVDPVLGKVLRNIKLALKKTKLFRTDERFGETYLVPLKVRPRPSAPLIPDERVEQQFFRDVLVSDSIVTMVRRLHTLLCEEQMYRAEVPLMSAALLFRKVYSMGWEAERGRGEVKENEGVAAVVQSEIRAAAEKVCREIGKTMKGMGGSSNRPFISTLKEILIHEFGEPSNDGLTYYERLKKNLPTLTRTQYNQKHKKRMEYLVRIGKKKMTREFLASGGKGEL